MQTGDIVTTGALFQSEKSKDKVAKLRYQVRGLFHFVKGTGHDSYIVRKLNKHASPELKLMVEDLYILQYSLKSCKHVDSSDTRYLNQSHTPSSNFTTKNSLTNHLQLSTLHFYMIMLRYHFPLKLHFLFLPYSNSMKTRPLFHRHHFLTMILISIVILLHLLNCMN